MPSELARRIIVGGWSEFAEKAGVNKKEDVETFEWIQDESERFYCEDCRAALLKIEGAKEWLKTYTCKERGYSLFEPFGDALANLMTPNHSGSSFTFILWRYKSLLNDWDTYVYETKKHVARSSYKKQQIDKETVIQLLDMAKEVLRLKEEEDEVTTPVLKGMIEPLSKMQQSRNAMDGFLLKCATYGLSESVETTMNILKEILEDHEHIEQEDLHKQREREYRELLHGLEFLYENPCRWFDSPSGCVLSPVHPKNVSVRAIEEMEIRHPGYTTHIAKVSEGITVFFKMMQYNEPDATLYRGILNAFMLNFGIIQAET